MGATDDQIDDLIEWEPGPPQAACASPLGALSWGARRAWRSKVLILWLWLLQFVLVARALRSLLPPTRFWPAGASEPTASAAVLDASSRLWSLSSTLQATMVGSLERPLWSPDVYFILFYGVLAGGAIAHLHAPRKGPFLAQFGAASGLYFGRFLRLLVVGAIGLWLLLGLVGLLAPGLQLRGGWLGIVALEVCVSLLALTIDYARVRTVARDSRSTLIEMLRSLRFVFRHFPQVLLLQLLLLAVGVLVAVGSLMLARGLDAAGAGAVGTFVAAQIYVVTRIWVRLAMWGSMLSLYQGLIGEKLARSSRQGA